jgi:hypothetical protein
MAEWERVKTIGDDKRKRLWAMSQEASIAIAKAAAIGEFIVSRETAQVLENLQKDLDVEEGGDPYEDAGREYDSLKKAIPKIRAEAKKDLRVE